MLFFLLKCGLSVILLAVLRIWLKRKSTTGMRLYMALSLTSLLLALLFSELFMRSGSDIFVIRATGESTSWTQDGSVLLSGWNIDGVDFDIREEDVVEGNWLFYDEDGDYVCGWQPSKEDKLSSEIHVRVPWGNTRRLLFSGGPFRGIAMVICPDGGVLEVNTFTQDEGDEYVLEIGGLDAALRNRLVLCRFAAFVLIALALIPITFVFCKKFCETATYAKINKSGFLFYELVKRDFTKKYKRTVLGMGWSMLSPLLQLLVMWLVFNQFFGNNVNHYVVYLFAGQLVFSFFTDSTNSGMEALLENADIFTKINIPKYLFLISKNVSSLINFGQTLIIFFLFVALDGIVLTWRCVLMIYPIVCLMVFNIGVGLALSALFVFFRDIKYLWGVFTMLLMYMSAIFYTIDGYSEMTRRLFLLNPVYLYIRYIRKVVIDATVPSIWFHLIAAGYALVLLGVGAWIYKKYNHEFLYYV